MDQATNIPNDVSLTGKRILLTGATGSIGRATAAKLADAGAIVTLSGRDVAKLELLAGSLSGSGHVVASYDLAESDGIVAWMNGLAEKNGAFSGLAHAAASQTTRPLRGMSAEFVISTMHMNVTTAIMLGKAFRQKACHTDHSTIVFMSSTAAFIGGGGNVPYAASKGAIISTTKAMAHELIRDKIRVNCVVSGLVEGDMAERARELTPPDSWQGVLAGYPMGIGHPNDIASAVVFLLSGRSRWMTGTDLQIDGGLSIV